MRNKNRPLKKITFFGLTIIGCLVGICSPSQTETTEAIRTMGSYVGTFEGSTTFATSSSNGINPGLLIEVIDDEGNLTQYESEEGVITIPNTKEGAYVTQAKFLGKTKYRDQDTGELLETWEEGRNLRLESVENPVLTTTGKNLFDLNGNINEKYNNMLASSNPNRVNGNTIIASSNTYNHHGKGQKIKVKSGEKYTCSFTTSNNGVVFINTPNKVNYELYKASTFTFTVPLDCDEIIVTFNTSGPSSGGKIHDFQIEEGSVSTSYAPYQSSTVTLNEEITLPGIGEVRDTFDLITGEVTKRIEQHTFNGTENWNFAPSNGGEDCTNFQTFAIGTKVKPGNSPLNCDKFAWVTELIQNKEMIKVGTGETNSHVYINVLNSRLTSPDVEGFRQWLSQNPVTIQYQFVTPVAKRIKMNSDYFFKPINKESIEVNGSIEPLTVSITVPTNPLSFVLNPNQEDGQQFIAPEFTLTNETFAPLQVELKVFEQTTDVLNDVLPDAYENWEGLNQTQSQDIALALVPKEGEGWLSLDEGPRYVVNTSNDFIGTVKGKSTVGFSFNALHGQSFSEVLNPQYRLAFVFGFSQ